MRPLSGIFVRAIEVALTRIYLHLILPFQQSHSPIPELAWGASIGMFIGITPTVGVQMYIAAAVWAVCRYGFGFHFNLPVAVGMVWISNPVTFLPMYYAYLVTGDWVLTWLGYPGVRWSFEIFRLKMQGAGSLPEINLLLRLVHGAGVLIVEFGWPMVLGSMVYAVPLTLLAYPITTVAMVRYRRRLAAREGLSYEVWKAKNVRLD
jgi:hypothetical protein